MKKAYTVRIDDEVLAAVQRLADAENRPVTNLIETLLIERCKEAGELPQDWKRVRGK